jgi:hypothetical protein
MAIIMLILYAVPRTAAKGRRTTMDDRLFLAEYGRMTPKNHKNNIVFQRKVACCRQNRWRMALPDPELPLPNDGSSEIQSLSRLAQLPPIVVAQRAQELLKIDGQVHRLLVDGQMPLPGHTRSRCRPTVTRQGARPPPPE